MGCLLGMLSCLPSKARAIYMSMHSHHIYQRSYKLTHTSFLCCTPGTLSDFYTSPQIKSWYKAYVKALLTRRNSTTGRVYSEDPCIFG